MRAEAAGNHAVTADPDAVERLTGQGSTKAPVLFGAFGNAADGKLFTTAIRAFALAGKLGDRLILYGFGSRRPRLVKWAEALGVDAIIDFVDHATDVRPDAIDVVIFLSAPDPQWQSAWASRCRMDVRVIALIGRSWGGHLPSVEHRTVPAGNVLALSTAMLAASR